MINTVKLGRRGGRTIWHARVNDLSSIDLDSKYGLCVLLLRREWTAIPAEKIHKMVGKIANMDVGFVGFWGAGSARLRLALEKLIIQKSHLRFPVSWEESLSIREELWNFVYSYLGEKTKNGEQKWLLLTCDKGIKTEHIKKWFNSLTPRT